MSKLSLTVALCVTALLPVAATAQAACPTGPLNPEVLTGWEHGRKGFHASTVLAYGSGVSYDSAARSGSYALRIGAAGAPSHGWYMWPSVKYTGVARFAMKLDSLPSADVAQLFGMDTMERPRSFMRIGYDAATQRLKLTLRSAITGRSAVREASVPVQADTWYVLDVRYDAATAAQTVDWAIDGVAQPSAGVLSTRPEPQYNVYLGTNAADTFTAHYDDLVLTGFANEYPVGDGRVHALLPDGSAPGAGTLRDDDGTPVDATSWQRLDETPALSTTDFIQQTTASSSAYARVEFQDTDQTCIRAVRGHTWTHSVKGTNNAKLVVVDGARQSVVKSGDWGGAGPSRDYSGAVAPATGWSQAAVNGLHARFGFSTDVSPAPILDGVLLEYEAVPQPEPEPEPAPQP